MTQPKRSLEEIAEELVGPHDYVEGDEWYSCGMAITPGEPERPGCSDESKRGRCGCRRSERAAEILAALREAAGTARRDAERLREAIRPIAAAIVDAGPRLPDDKSVELTLTPKEADRIVKAAGMESNRSMEMKNEQMDA